MCGESEWVNRVFHILLPPTATKIKKPTFRFSHQRMLLRLSDLAARQEGPAAPAGFPILVGVRVQGVERI